MGMSRIVTVRLDLGRKSGEGVSYYDVVKLDARSSLHASYRFLFFCPSGGLQRSWSLSLSLLLRREVGRPVVYFFAAVVACCSFARHAALLYCSPLDTLKRNLVGYACCEIWHCDRMPRELSHAKLLYATPPYTATTALRNIAWTV